MEDHKPDDETIIQQGSAEPSDERAVVRYCNRRRATQRVTPVMSRKSIVSWMEEEIKAKGTEKGILGRTVREFPDVFRAHDHLSAKSAATKVSRWWKDRSNILNSSSRAISRPSRLGRKRGQLKVIGGRGRERCYEPPCASHVYNRLCGPTDAQ
jgi:hypothetical protein